MCLINLKFHGTDTDTDFLADFRVRILTWKSAQRAWQVACRCTQTATARARRLVRRTFFGRALFLLLSNKYQPVLIVGCTIGVKSDINDCLWLGVLWRCWCVVQWWDRRRGPPVARRCWWTYFSEAETSTLATTCSTAACKMCVALVDLMRCAMLLRFLV